MSAQRPDASKAFGVREYGRWGVGNYANHVWLPAPAARSSPFFCTPFSCCKHHQRNGSSDCACMTVPSPNYLDNVSSRASRMRIEPQDPIQSLLLPGISPVLWKPHIVAVSIQQVWNLPLVSSVALRLDYQGSPGTRELPIAGYVLTP